MTPVNVLYVFGDRLRRGGIENFMMNYFRYIDRNIIHIDFVVQGKRRGAYDDEIERAGSCIYRLPKPGKNPVSFAAELKKIFRMGKYQIVHAHCDAMNYRILRLAKQCNIPVRISHSHNTEHVLASKCKIKFWFYEYSKKKVHDYATTCFACSEEAGRWMYGKHEFEIIPNAIVLDRFRFQEKDRIRLRGKYDIPDNAVVLGHVGRFDRQKNHLFLIELLKKLAEEENRRYYLLLVGNGWMRSVIEEKVKEYRLEKHVIFTGEVDNPQAFYNMMDIFLMPSLFEGYPIALEEAEVNGLPCLVSEFITKEVAVTEIIEYSRLDLDTWYQKIQNLIPPRRCVGAESVLREKGYDIKDAAKRLQDEYINLCQNMVK